ncbi:MAG TPA: glycosyltransferase family 2 protein [Acidobacteriaceae bacterium]|nr:glycosyltransferase family 2 protein [Acidobacteriaceae bacterium]
MTKTASLPRVVALVPAWRSAAFIQETLASLAAQSYPNLHILISDDASPDHTAQICEEFAAQRENTRVIRQPRNLGWVDNVNALLAAAAGDYFFFAFHDDVLKPMYVERLANALTENPAAVISFSDLETRHLDGTIEMQEYTLLEGITEARSRGRQVLSRDGTWWAPNRGLFRASTAREIGGMRKHLAGECSADLPWLLRLALIGEFVRVPEALVVKRFTQQSLSRSWQHNRWQRFGLQCACIQAIRSAGLPLTDELLLQLSVLQSWGQRLGRSLGRHVPNIRAGETH